MAPRQIHMGEGTNCISVAHNPAYAPLTPVFSYLEIRPSSPGPLFIHADGTPLTWSQLVNSVRSALQSIGLDVSPFLGHSFHTGAATAVAQKGILDSFIQTFGRWRSSAFLCYIRTPTSTLFGASEALSHQPIFNKPTTCHLIHYPPFSMRLFSGVCL